MTVGAAPHQSLEDAALRSADRPNILLILTDDQDLLLRSLEFMPHVRELLARQGLTFSNYFVPLSLCCPSRTSILRGQFAHNTQVYTNKSSDGGFARFLALGHEKETIATALHDAGYRTALFGKYLNHYPEGSAPTHVPPGWDEWHVPASGNPYREFDYVLNDNGALHRHGHAAQDYLTDVMGAQAQAFIREAATRNMPFFAYVAPYAPHIPATPAPRHAKLFARQQAPRTPAFNESNVRDKPPPIRTLPLLSRAAIGQIDNEYRQRLRSLQAVDEMVEQLVGVLTATGQLENTYIFFSSDNGYHMGQHRMKPGKYTPYEEDIRVPLIVRGPGVEPGTATTSFAMNIDLAPTFADLAGATLRDDPDGRSLGPLLQGTSPAGWRQAVFLEQFHFVEEEAPPGSVLEPLDASSAAATASHEHASHLGLRTADYKYVEYEGKNRELYDLHRDPHELRNAQASLTRGAQARLSAAVHALAACKGASCRQLDSQAPPEF